jgi:hypothetical protein
VIILANPAMETQIINVIYVQKGIFRQMERVSLHALQDSITQTNIATLVIKIV